MTPEPERVMIFIDGNNLYYGLRDTIGKTNIDLTKLAKKLCDKNRKLIRTYYYNAPLDRKHNKKKYKILFNEFAWTTMKTEKLSILSKGMTSISL